MVKVSLRGKGEVPVNRSRAASAGAVTRTRRVARVPRHARRRHRHRPRGRSRGPRRARPVTAARPGAPRSGVLAVEKGPGVTSFQVVAHRPPSPPRAQGRPRRHPRSRRHRPPAHPGRRGNQAHAVSRRARQGIRGAGRALGLTTDTQDVSGKVLTTRPVPAARRRRPSPPPWRASWARSTRSRPCTPRSITRAAGSTSWRARARRWSGSPVA